MSIAATPKEIAFPVFDPQQMEFVKAIGDAICFSRDEELISQGQKDYPFYVIESGEVRIVEKCADHETPITTHGPGSFTGDVDMLTGRSAVISAIANGPVQAYRLCAWRLRQLLGSCPKASEMLLKAFQLRRRLLEASDFVGVRMIGEADTRATSRMREFFYKNHVPHTFFDANSDAGQSQLTCLQAETLPIRTVHQSGTAG